MLKMKAVIDPRKAAGLRDRVHVMIGGAPVDDKFAHDIGADFFSEDAPGGSSHAREYVRGAKAQASGENGGPMIIVGERINSASRRDRLNLDSAPPAGGRPA